MKELEASLPEEPASLWIDVALQYASTRGYTFDPSCRADLVAFFGNAAERLRASGKESAASSFNQAVQVLVEYMIESLREESPVARELHEWTLANARTRFCPLFPFC